MKTRACGGGKGRALVIFFVGCLALCILFFLSEPSLNPLVISYSVFTITMLVVKLAASISYSPRRKENTGNLEYAVIIPVFNEDPVLFRRSIESVLHQSRTPREVYVVDDCSSSTECYELALALKEANPHMMIDVRRLDENSGKRRAQYEGFLKTRCPIVLTMDSDTLLERAVAERLLASFCDRSVLAVTGCIRVLNANRNLLTRLIDVRYSAAFEFERAAHAKLDSVICACGALTAWRTWVIKEHLDDYINQTFLGRQVQYGDDRRLSNYCLLHGRIAYEPDAVGYTLVPYKLHHFMRQQLRWNKSYIRESLFTMKYIRPTRLSWIVLTTDILMWAGLIGVLTYSLVVAPFVYGIAVMTYYPLFLVVFAYMRSANHRLENELNYVLVPFYAVVHLFLLVPLKLLALCTLKDGGWGTRKEGIEVQISDCGHDTGSLSLQTVCRTDQTPSGVARS